jgi:hypothetical protein
VNLCREWRRRKGMFDRGKIITGLIIGIGLLSYPFWPSAGKWAGKVPEPELSPKAKEAKECVEPKSFIRTEHMRLLDAWRDQAVRRANRVYKSSNGKIYDISLQNTCMECHPNKSTFCDQCHNYMGVAPYCWDCHIAPKESK